MKNKNRLISFVLAVIMTVSVIPISAFGEGDTIKYNIQKPKVGIMNRVSSENDLFRRNYLRAADDNFNLAYKFGRTSANNVSGAGKTLSYNTSMMHSENGDYWKAYYEWTYQEREEINVGAYKYKITKPKAGNEVMVDLISKGQIKLDLSADLTADKHWNLTRHLDKILDRAYVSLTNKDENGGNSFLSMASDRNAPDESAVNFRKTQQMVSSSHLAFELYFTGLGCQCGSSKVSKVSVGLIDDINPSIQNIYASRDSEGKLKEQYGFKAGETGYLNLIFNESIRFANDTIPSSPVLLNLKINGTADNVEIKTDELKAKLVELSGNKMTFKFVVPEKIKEQAANVYISGISGAQDWVNNNITGNKSFPLVIFGKDGAKITLKQNLSNIEELNYVTSLVTDMAGNPIDWNNNSTKNLSEFCFLDNVKPVAKSVEIQGARISKESNQSSQEQEWPKDIDRSTVFAGIGDKLDYSVKLSEEIRVPNDKIDEIVATINASKDGSPVKLKATNIVSNIDGVNGIKVSTIIFETLNIDSTMIPDGTGEPLKIAEIKFPSGTEDLRYNTMDNLKNEQGSIVIPAPAQQQFLDINPPIAATSITEAEGKYAPVYYEGAINIKEFYFPITVEDLDSINNNYTSRINGVLGSFAWLDETTKESYPFYYYVSASPYKPNADSYTEAYTSNSNDNLNYKPFKQVETGNYIHIKLKDGVKYNINESSLIIMPKDNAQNKGKDEFRLNYSADYVAPEIIKIGEKNSYDAVNDGTMEVLLLAKDLSGVNPDDVEYQWVEKGEDAVSGSWISAAETTYIDNISVKVSIKKNGLISGTTYEYDLLVKARDKKGNELEEALRFSCIYDLQKANPNLEIISEIDKPVEDIVIGMELYRYSGDDPSMENLPSKTILMIKNPESEDNEYFITILSSHVQTIYESDPTAHFATIDLFDDIKENYRTWYSARMTRENNGALSFSDSENIEYGSSKRRIINSIVNHEDSYTNAYYGNVDLMFVTAYGNVPEMFDTYILSGINDFPNYFDLTNGQLGEHTPFYLEGVDGIYFVKTGSGLDYNNSFYYKYLADGETGGTTTPSAINGNAYEIVDVNLPITKINGNINIQEYRLMLAPEKYTKSTADIEFVNAVQEDGTEGLLWNENYVLGETAKYLKNLDGAKISFTLKNTEEPSWGVLDMDFDSEDTYAALYYTEHGVSPSSGGFLQKDGNPLEFSDGGRYLSISELTPLIKTKPVATTDEQSFIIPNDLTEKIGFYALEISIKSVNSGRVTKKYFVDMFADGSKSILNNISNLNVCVSDSNDREILSNYTYVNSNNMLLGTASQDGYKIDRSMYFDIDYVKPVKTNVNVYQFVYYGLNEENQRYPAFHYPDTSLFGGIKIWNAASSEDGKVPDYVQWIDYNSIIINDIKFKIVDSIDELKSSSSYIDEGEFVLPVIKDGNNTICYQLTRSNGYVSPIMQLNITASSAAPEYELKLDSDKTQAWVQSVIASAENAVSLNGVKKFGYGVFEGEGGYDEDSLNSLIVDRNGKYFFYIMDNAGNVSIVKKDIDWIDSEIPTILASKDNSAAENEFKVTVTMSDNHDLTKSKLYLSFDKDYSELLNRNSGEIIGGTGITDEIVSVEIPLAEAGIGEWIAKDSGENHSGIYKTNTVLSNDKLTKTVEIWGAFKYDDKIADDTQISRRFVFTGSDMAGNFSKSYETGYDDEHEEYISDELVEGTYLDINSKNIKPELKTATMDSNDRVKLEFTAAVLVTSPHNSNPAFGRYTDSAAIYNDGACNITYRDLFGKEYSIEKNINLFGRFNAVIEFSETRATQNDVNVIAALQNENNDVEITAIAGIKSDNSIINGAISEDKKSASIIMTDNGKIKISMKAADGETKERIADVSNVDRKIETVTPYIYYTAGEPTAGQTATDGAVVMGLQCEELLTGTNGPLTYTFTNGARRGDSYTFEYEDMAKNEGSYTFVLDYDIIYDIPDTSSPEYSLVFYSKLDYINQQGESFTEINSPDDDIKNKSLTDIVNALPKSQGYMLLFNIFDESRVKLIVKSNDTVPGYSDNSDLIDGVTLGDRSITIDKNCEFKAYLVDERGNITSLSKMEFNKIDTISPTATVEYSAVNFYSTIGYLMPSEDIMITNIFGVKKSDAEGKYKDKYYHEYEQNENFTFYYKDMVGNTGSTEANVNWLDVNPPQLISLKWTPSKEDQSKESRIYAPPSEHINTDVIAQAGFNKTVSEVKAYYKGTENEVESSKIKISFIQNGATITYNENADIDLYFKSPNGKSSKISLGKVDCIDKIKPKINHSSSISEDKQSEEFTFSSDEAVYMAEDLQSGEKAFKTEFKYTFKANGAYDMHFTDKAGNSVVYELAVSGLDKEIMRASFNTESSDTGAVDSAAKLNMDNKTKFYVKLSKNGSVNYEGTTKAANKNVWVEFDFAPINDKVFYMIEAVDSVVGTKIYSYIGVELPDKIPPTIILPTSAISIKEGNSAVYIADKLNSGVVVSDNKDTGLSASIVEIKTETDAVIQITDNMPVGKYKVKYEAKDNAGNTSVVYRTLRIYDKNSINATINGEAAEPWGTMVINTQEITLSIENLLSTNGIEEPCKVYYKAGLMTAGQMKTRASKVETDKFTLSGTGFYTIYIQAQDRKDYITYIYIEK